MTEIKSQEQTNRSLHAHDEGSNEMHQKVGDQQEPFELSVQEFSELAARIEQALVEDNSALNDVSGEIKEAMAWHVSHASSNVSDVVHGESSADSELRTAYALGHLSFAHLLVEQTTSRLASNAFYEAFDDPKFVGTIDALARKEMTNSALADELKLRQETVSRNLRALRELGITAFRKIGTQAFNYLTPAAMAFRDGSDSHPVVPRQTRITLDERVRSIPSHLREQSILSD